MKCIAILSAFMLMTVVKSVHSKPDIFIWKMTPEEFYLDSPSCRMLPEEWEEERYCGRWDYGECHAQGKANEIEYCQFICGEDFETGVPLLCERIITEEDYNRMKSSQKEPSLPWWAICLIVGGICLCIPILWTAQKYLGSSIAKDEQEAAEKAQKEVEMQRT